MMSYKLTVIVTSMGDLCPLTLAGSTRERGNFLEAALPPLSGIRAAMLSVGDEEHLVEAGRARVDARVERPRTQRTRAAGHTARVASP